jgi:murein L,D-transpeptidase YafK
MKKYFFGKNVSRFILVFLIVWLLQLYPASAYSKDYELIIYKNKQELIVKAGNQIIKTFHIATGKGGNGTKRQLGDKKTPLGVYKVVNFRSDSKFHFFMQLDYPNLIDAWYGYKNEVITAGEFKKIASAYKNKQMPPQDTALGGYIGIHGLGKITEQRLSIHQSYDWTEGCIAVTNDQINELRQYVKIGTPVMIHE